MSCVSPNMLSKFERLLSPDDAVWHKMGLDADNVFPADFALLSGIEQQILLNLSQYQETTFAEIETSLEINKVHLSKSLQDLVELGFIHRTATGYAINSQIFVRWLASRKSSGEIPAPLTDPTVIELHPIDERQKQLGSQLKTHYDNLAHYQEIKAKSGFDVPLRVINDLNYEEDIIREIEQQLEDFKRRKAGKK